MTHLSRGFVGTPWTNISQPTEPRTLDVWALYEIEQVKLRMTDIVSQWLLSETVRKCLENMRKKALELWARQEEINTIYRP